MVHMLRFYLTLFSALILQSPAVGDKGNGDFPGMAELEERRTQFMEQGIRSIELDSNLRSPDDCGGKAYPSCKTDQDCYDLMNKDNPDCTHHFICSFVYEKCFLHTLADRYPFMGQDDPVKWG